MVLLLLLARAILAPHSRITEIAYIIYMMEYIVKRGMDDKF
jgi:hypothetical protein